MLQKYIELFSRLRTDRNADWPESSLGRSPYKPLLLLAVFDLIESGEIDSNLIGLTGDLGDIFRIYCIRDRLRVRRNCQIRIQVVNWRDEQK
jgi:hypothetical protein